MKQANDIKYCRLCNIELTLCNWNNSHQKLGNYICKTCSAKTTYKWRLSKGIILKPEQKNKSHKYCIRCYTELTKINWKGSNEKRSRYYCNECNKKYFNEWNKKNRGSINKKQREIYKKNKKTFLFKEKKKENDRKYRQTTKGRETSKRFFVKRRRHMAFVPLNDYFKGSHAHHIDIEHVIYIPEILNRSIRHNVHTGYNMEIINTYAFFFLLQRNIDKVIKIFKGGNLCLDN